MVLCPKCKTHRTDRSHRRGLFEHCIAVAGYYPYRCRNCQRRFLRFRCTSIKETAAAETEAVHPRVQREIRATRGAMKAKRKRRELLLYGVALVLFLVFLYYVTREHGDRIEGRAAAPESASHSAPIAS